MTLLRRIVAEKRAIVVPLAVALVVNILLYVLAVRPLGVKAATVTERAAAAALARQGAERDMAAAQALVSGKARAEEELATFYQKVLPSNFDAAHRMTYARIPALARKASVRYKSRHSEADQRDRTDRLGRLHTQVVLEGDYESLRQFIYELETTSEFIIIDDVTLSQSELNMPLTLTLDLSTYYRLESRGA